MERRSEKDRVKIFNQWSSEEKTWLDYLDGAVADLLVENEDGRISLKENMTGEEHRLYWKWERRSKDPAYHRMREVIFERVSAGPQSGIAAYPENGDLLSSWASSR